MKLTNKITLILQLNFIDYFDKKDSLTFYDLLDDYNCFKLIFKNNKKLLYKYGQNVLMWTIITKDLQDIQYMLKIGSEITMRILNIINKLTLTDIPQNTKKYIFECVNVTSKNIDQLIILSAKHNILSIIQNYYYKIKCDCHDECDSQYIALIESIRCQNVKICVYLLNKTYYTKSELRASLCEAFEIGNIKIIDYIWSLAPTHSEDIISYMLIIYENNHIDIMINMLNFYKYDKDIMDEFSCVLYTGELHDINKKDMNTIIKHVYGVHLKYVLC